MSKWKKIVYLIAAVIIFIIVQIWFKQIERRAEEENYPYEVARKEKASFEGLTEYCREHEDMYMEISEEVFRYLDEGLSKDEVHEAVENTATSEQKEILEQTLLRFPCDNGNYEDVIFKELIGNGVYYICNGEGTGRRIKVVYIHEYSEAVEEYITSMEYTTTIKINDHLYVCYTKIPYT